MNTRKRLLIIGALTSTVALTPTMASAAGCAFFFNSATAINIFHGEQFRVSFKVNQTNSHSVKTVNHAYAKTSHCSQCNTAAIAFQIVVAPMNSSLKVDNEAKAVEDHCINCSNLASAYDIVLEVPNPHLSGDTLRALQQIKQRLECLRSSGLTGDALQAAIDELAGEAQSVLLLGVAQPAPVAAAKPAATSLALAAPVPASTPRVLVYRQASSQ